MNKKVKKISSCVLAFCICISMCLGNVGYVLASDGTAYLSVGSSILYSSIGFDNGYNWGGRYFTLSIDETERIAYCLEPDKTYPMSNDYAYEVVSSNENLQKTLYYGYGGPAASEYMDVSGLSGDAQYIITHVVAAYFYGSDKWDYGLNGTGKTYAEAFINYVLSAPNVPDTKLNLSGNALTAINQGSYQQTNEITLNGDSRNYITITLQSGVTLHNITKGTADTGTVKVYGGDTFFLTADLNLTATQSAIWSSGDLIGDITYSFAPIVFNVANTTQTMGGHRWFYDPSDPVSFTVNWLESGNVEIVKTAEDGIVSGLKFKLEGNGVSETVTTDNSGVIHIDSLVPGTYTISEVETSDRYVQPASQTVTVEAGKTVTVNFSNVLKKWNVTVTKTDRETDTTQGAATLAGAVYGIFKDGILVDEYTTDENGQFTTDHYICGTGWTLKEISASKGYLLDETEYSIGAEAGNFVVESNALTTGVTEQIIRGDLKGVKVSDGDMKRMAGVPFAITSVTTGESHIVVTDENGQFDTSSSWNKHSQDTNRGETANDGVWFGGGAVNDKLGALPYDTYMIEELPCAANEGKVILEPFAVMVYKDSVTIDLGTITNDYEPQPEIGTTATDKATGGHIGYVNETTTIIDVVEYVNLTVGLEYTVKGILMDKATGEVLLVDGKDITAELTFTPEEPSGSIEMEFTFDSSALKGKEIVVFESLYYGEKEIAVHADITDAGQTVKFAEPEIGTTATDKATGEHTGYVNETTTIIDVIEYKELIAGFEYTVKGILMDKETGEALLVKGKEVTAELTFTPEEPSGSIELEFTFDSNALKGKEVVVFESLYYGKKEIAVHADITDAGQTVKFAEPEIGTTATDKATGEHTGYVSKTTTIIDVVEYKGLVAGLEYTVKGILMDKTTGEALLVDGKEVAAELTFTPEESSGSVEMEFTFDSSALKGKEIVVFESLYYGEKEVAVHADITDAGQTVKLVESSNKINTSVKTGDTSNIIIASLLFAGACIGFGFITYKKYKARKK